MRTEPPNSSAPASAHKCRRRWSMPRLPRRLTSTRPTSLASPSRLQSKSHRRPKPRRPRARPARRLLFMSLPLLFLLLLRSRFRSRLLSLPTRRCCARSPQRPLQQVALANKCRPRAQTRLRLLHPANITPPLALPAQSSLRKPLPPQLWSQTRRRHPLWSLRNSRQLLLSHRRRSQQHPSRRR
jgi:hypothetical protein